VCSSPRYAYINNSALGGAVPTMISNTLALSPHHLMMAMSGQSVPSYMDVDSCPVVDTTK
jgi:hypothetical protein